MRNAVLEKARVPGRASRRYEEPRREPETADADLLRHGSAPCLGLLAILSLGFDVCLKHELDVTGQRAPIRPSKLRQSLLEAWREAKAYRGSTGLRRRRGLASHLVYRLRLLVDSKFT